MSTDTHLVTTSVNGRQVSAEVPARMLLVHYVRDEVGATGTHVGCDTGSCGACTVLVDGAPMKSCMMLAVQAEAREITTVEGLDGSEADALREAFTHHGAVQCGYCTPGMLVNATALLRCGRTVDDATVRRTLKGNLCMCTGYQQIVDAVVDAGNRSGSATGTDETREAGA